MDSRPLSPDGAADEPSAAARFVSTRGRAEPVGLGEALTTGTAPDGGLWLPAAVPRLDDGALARFADLDTPAVAARVLAPFLAGALARGEIEALCREALDFPLPLVEPPGGEARILELFHGPTLAFKDVGARFLAGLLERLAPGDGRPTTVLVATSGDTGAAVADAFRGRRGARVVVLYPRGRVSPLQEAQLAGGDGVVAAAVEGTFDDCQRLVKEALADAELARRHRLVSANSINLGRLLPQMVYYFVAAARLPPGAPPPLFVVPSGNLGNVTAGLLARRRGLAAAGLLAATNANDALPRLLAGEEPPHGPAVRTLSTAMDVAIPSNLERLLALAGGGAEGLARELVALPVDDAATRRAIRRVHHRSGIALDPHTAVAWAALERARERWSEPLSPIVLATAHPAKFPEVVEPLIGRRLELPRRLAALAERPFDPRTLAPDLDALRRLLRDLP